MLDLSPIIEAALGDQTTVAFLLAILAVFTFGVLGLFIRIFAVTSYTEGIAVGAPNLMTTLGVLGTFTGIFLGLMDFDVADINASVPQLLAGMKIAFITSIAGMGAAILFRFLRGFLPAKRSGSSGTDIDDLHAVLTEIRKANQGQSEALLKALEAVRSSIASEGDPSMVTQVQKLRTVVQDGQQELITEFRQFAKHMAENNQKALIEALESVIRDFNSKLSEQFGENFKQLNSAVGALLVWQENYKTHVEQVEQRLNRALEGVEVCEEALRNILSHASAIPDAIGKLDPALEAINSQTSHLNTHLSAFAELRDRAINAFPIIEKNLAAITTEVTELVADATNDIADAVEAQRDQAKQLLDHYNTLGQELTGAHSAIGTAISASIEKMGTETTAVLTRQSDALDATAKEIQRQLVDTHTSLGEAMTASIDKMGAETATALTRQSDLLDATAKEMQRQIADAWSRTEEAINQRMGDLDKEMSNELTRALNLLGNNLASISEKFASDYTPLAERLREIVQISTKVA